MTRSKCGGFTKWINFDGRTMHWQSREWGSIFFYKFFFFFCTFEVGLFVALIIPPGTMFSIMRHLGTIYLFINIFFFLFYQCRNKSGAAVFESWLRSKKTKKRKNNYFYRGGGRGDATKDIRVNLRGSVAFGGCFFIIYFFF